MNNCFLSVIGVLDKTTDVQQLHNWLTNIFVEINPRFSDWEIILVNNLADRTAPEPTLRDLPQDLRKNIFLLNLSTPVNRNHAILAGLDRANGDYTALFEFEFSNQAALLTQLYERSQMGFDIVYLRSISTKISPFHSLFHWILRRFSQLHLDDRAHHSRLISRRALNSLLRLRENMRYMKALYSLVGYNTSFLEVENPLPETEISGREKVRTAFVAITSYTSFLRSIMGWVFIFSVAVASVASFNAIKVKLTNVDIFGEHVESLSGWAFLVVLISVFFAITCLNLYIISIYLSNIYQEIKNRPPYIIESTKRY